MVRRSVGGHVRVRRRTWQGDMCGSVCGAIFGVLVLAAGVWLLVWNEGHAVQEARSLAEGLDLVVSVPSNRVLDINEGSLVHVSGYTEQPVLVDPDFGVEARGVQLHRVVEMYQAHERRTTRTVNRGGEKVAVTEYEYYTDWSSQRIDSDRFDDPSYANPRSWPVAQDTFSAGTVPLGAWTLDKHVLSGVDSSTSVPLHHSDRQTMRDGKRAHNTIRGFDVAGDKLYLERNSYSNPRVGDVRISWKVTSADMLSVVGKQHRGTLVPYAARAGGDILLVTPKLASAPDMFATAQTAGAFRCWLLRVVGYIIVLVACLLFTAPLAVFVEGIPCFGTCLASFVSCGANLAAFAVSIVITAVVIAVAWLAQRPWLSALLFAVAAAPLLLPLCGNKRRKMVDGKERMD